MVACAVEVRKEAADKLRLPWSFAEGALLLLGLERRGVLAEAARRVWVDRQGGFCGVDALVYLVLYFASMPGFGLRAMWGAVGEAGTRLGALVGRDTVMSRSSLSRLLGAIQVAEVNQFARWLLLEASGVLAVLREEVAQTVDAQGVARRVFAYDPVRIAIRHRGLPEDEDLPPPNRRTQRLGAPGRTARKRGEVVCSMGVLEDLGSSAVLDVQLSPGNGEARTMFKQVVEAVLATLSSLGETLEPAILLADGEFGTVPYLTMCAEAGLAFITRSSRYDLLDDPAIWQRLLNARWVRVEDSKSGPVRYAADVGSVRIFPGQNTRRDGGHRYGPLDVRLVVTRFDAPDGGHGCGHQIDGSRYELFVSIGVLASSLPAADVVAMFYARCGQECSFQQHQHDLDVQRVFSTNTGGQLFAWVVALFVWNLRLAAGVQLSPPLPPRSAPSARQCILGCPPEPRPSAPEAEAPASDPSPVDSVEPQVSAASRLDDARAAALERLNWSTLLRHRPGWSWDPIRRGLLTPDGLLLRFVAVEWIRHRAKLRFIDVDHKRQATLAVPPDLARGISTARGSSGRSPPPTATDEPGERSIDLPTAPEPHPTRLIAEATDNDHAPYSIGWSELLRAAARNVLSDLAATVEITVRQPRIRPSRPTHPLVEPRRARRQHRRLTREERLARHATRGKAVVRVTTTSTQPLEDWLRPPPSDVPAARPTM
ncbi:transposase [Methyloglobulus sp.]|uniref:transposase n=1 Tax=Methyloglobulus sp. TaxID=2518622 RepID=UPI0032B7EFDA